MPDNEPDEVRAALLLWLVGVAAGMFEVGLTVLDTVSGGSVPSRAVVVGALVRLLVALCVCTLLTDLQRGRHRARVLLALLGGLGLVIDPMTWQALPGLHHSVDVLTLGRAAHLGAILLAVGLTFKPQVRWYFNRVHSGLPADLESRAERVEGMVAAIGSRQSH